MAFTPVTPEVSTAIKSTRFWDKLYTPTTLLNLLGGALSGGIGPAIGGTAGAILLHKLQQSGNLGALGKSEFTPLLFGSLLGNLLGRGQSKRRLESGIDSLTGTEELPMPMLRRKKQEDAVPADIATQATEPELAETPMDMKKESSMNTVEELFKAATQALEEKVFVPTVLAKLAERGYKAETKEEMAEILKYAGIVRKGVAEGEISPIPARELDPAGQITKAAADAASQDFLAFAPEVEVDLGSVEPVIKEAATVLTWGFMQSVVQNQAQSK